MRESDPRTARGLRVLTVATWAAAGISAAASAGVMWLQLDPAYVRSRLTGHDFGTVEVSAEQVTAAQGEPMQVWLVAAGVLAFGLLCHVLIARRVRLVRPLGSLAAVLGLLSAAFWSIDAGRMVGLGGAGPVVLALLAAMMAACAGWLVVAWLRPQRDALARWS